MRSPREEARTASARGAGDLELDRADAAMERYARGDDRAFAELYDALAPRLRRFLLRACRDPGRADDLLQQTMLRIHRARGRFIPGAQVAPWAFAIARRLLIDSARRRKNELRTISLETGGDEAGPVEAAAVQHGAEELIDGERLARALAAELERLPESQRRAFELVRGEGLSIRDAAEALGATASAVKLRAHRAYAALRVALNEARGRA
jgi:RNA polymerase sigma-70 factor (ECF subfamily)